MAARSRHRITWRALRVVTGGLVVGGVVAGAGVAGAAQQAADATIATDNSTAFLPPDVSISTGDTVTWNFAARHAQRPVLERRAGRPELGRLRDPGPQHRHVRLHVHAARDVRVRLHHPLARDAAGRSRSRVSRSSRRRPPRRRTPPASTPTPGPQPPASGGSGSSPPAPGGTTPPPGIRRARRRRASHLGPPPRGDQAPRADHLTLSETATVTVRVKQRRSGKVVRTARLQVRAGKRTFAVRGGRLKRGRYVVELRARDSGGTSPSSARASGSRRARMSAAPNPFRPPADAWSRRDFLRNSFGAVALVCTLGGPGHDRRPEAADLRRAAGTCPSRCSRPSDATCRSCLRPRQSRRRTASASSTLDIREGIAEILPGMQTPSTAMTGSIRAHDPRD